MRPFEDGSSRMGGEQYHRSFGQMVGEEDDQVEG